MEVKKSCNNCDTNCTNSGGSKLGMRGDWTRKPDALSNETMTLAVKLRAQLRACQREKRRVWQAMQRACGHNDEGRCFWNTGDVRKCVITASDCPAVKAREMKGDGK